MRRTLVFRNEIAEISRLQGFVESVGEELSLDPSLVMGLNLALEEAVANVVLYAYSAPGEGEIRLSAEWEAEAGELCFVLLDQGVPFDPTGVPNADVTLAVEDRPIGGLGILLIRNIMDEVAYRREDGCNVLTMKKRISLPTGE